MGWSVVRGVVKCNSSESNMLGSELLKIVL